MPNDIPGLGQAAQTGVEIANRAIVFRGPVAGTAVDGLLETFSPLAKPGWIKRIVDGIAGIEPPLPDEGV